MAKATTKKASAPKAAKPIVSDTPEQAATESGHHAAPEPTEAPAAIHMHGPGGDIS